MSYASKLKDRILGKKYKHGRDTKYTDNREDRGDNSNFNPYDLVNTGHKVIESGQKIYKNLVNPSGQAKTAKAAYKQSKYLLKQKQAELKAAKLDAKIEKLKRKH